MEMSDSKLSAAQMMKNDFEIGISSFRENWRGFGTRFRIKDYFAKRYGPQYAHYAGGFAAFCLTQWGVKNFVPILRRARLTRFTFSLWSGWFWANRLLDFVVYRRMIEEMKSGKFDVENSVAFRWALCSANPFFLKDEQCREESKAILKTLAASQGDKRTAYQFIMFYPVLFAITVKHFLQEAYQNTHLKIDISRTLGSVEDMCHLKIN